MNREIHVLGGKASGKRNRDAAVKKYYENPHRCIKCNSVIEIRDGVKVFMSRRKKFCSHSCAAKYNNLARVRTHQNPDVVMRAVKSIRDYNSRKEYLKGMVVSYRQKTKRRAVDYLGGKCSACGYNRSVYALVFHHREPDQKDFPISGVTRSWSRVQKELDKCELLCLNCHAELHERIAG